MWIKPSVSCKNDSFQFVNNSYYVFISVILLHPYSTFNSIFIWFICVYLVPFFRIVTSRYFPFILFNFFRDVYCCSIIFSVSMNFLCLMLFFWFELLCILLLILILVVPEKNYSKLWFMLVWHTERQPMSLNY